MRRGEREAGRKQCGRRRCGVVLWGREGETRQLPIADLHLQLPSRLQLGQVKVDETNHHTLGAVDKQALNTSNHCRCIQLNPVAPRPTAETPDGMQVAFSNHPPIGMGPWFPCCLPDSVACVAQTMIKGPYMLQLAIRNHPISDLHRHAQRSPSPARTSGRCTRLPLPPSSSASNAVSEQKHCVLQSAGVPSRHTLPAMALTHPHLS